MSALGEVYSGIFTASSYAGLAAAVAGWLAGVPGLSRVYDNEELISRAYNSTDGEIIFGLYAWTGGGREEEAIGLRFGVTASVSNNTYTLDNGFRLTACTKLYASESNNRVTPHGAAVNNDKTNRTMACSKKSAGGSTLYSLGAWYAQTGHGVIVGLYTDDIKLVTSNYPVYLGTARNEVRNEDLILALHLNRGAAVVAGALAQYSAELSTGKAMIAGESEIIESPGSRTVYTAYLSAVRPPTPSPSITADTVLYTPLYVTLGVWCQPIHLDNMYAGTFKSTNYPPLLEDIVPPEYEDDPMPRITYTTVSYDGVAVKTERGVY